MDGTRVEYQTQTSPSNGTNEGECQLGVPEETRPYVIVGFCLIMVVTVSGNSIVIVVLGIVTNLRNDLNNYLLNLAVADLLVSLFCNPAKTFYIMSEDWTLGSSACSAFIAIQHVSILPLSVIIFRNGYINSCMWSCYAISVADDAFKFIVSVVFKPDLESEISIHEDQTGSKALRILNGATVSLP